ncbi:MAG: thermonuclease family protein [Brevinematales bacterium]|nr:thermonuclease family protein [Brevinematales bacterium]
MKKISLFIFLVLFLFLFTPLILYGVRLEGVVVDVEDGDTITIRTKDGKYYDIRLLGIDAPETKRNAKFKRDTTKVEVAGEYNVFIRIPPNSLIRLGNEAKYELRRLILNKTVLVDIEDVDRYKRNLGWVWYDNMLVNEYMVRNGLARPYMLKKRSAYYYRILNAEDKAKREKLGIYAY